MSGDTQSTGSCCFNHRVVGVAIKKSQTDDLCADETIRGFCKISRVGQQCHS